MKLTDEVKDWKKYCWQRKEFVLFDSEGEPVAKGKATIRCNKRQSHVVIAGIKIGHSGHPIGYPASYGKLGRLRACPWESLPPADRDEVDRRLRDRAATRLIEQYPGEAADLLGVPRGRPFWKLIISNRRMSSGDQKAFVDSIREHERAATVARQAEQARIRRAKARRDRAQGIASRDAQRSRMDQAFGNETADGRRFSQR